jgi:hypothetical protein
VSKRTLSAKDTRNAFIDQVVAAGLASREHARRVIERNEQAVIMAWQRALDPVAEAGCTEADVREIEQQFQLMLPLGIDA